MDLNQDLIAPDFRIPFPAWLPQGDPERSTAEYLFRNIRQLGEQSNNLAAALALIDLSDMLPFPAISVRSSLFWLWRLMAFREGAMALSNFAKTLELARHLVPQCPSYAPLIDKDGLRKIGQEFRSRFRRVEKLRDSAAHPELHHDPKVEMEPSSFHDRHYFAKAFGVNVEYDLTEHTVRYVLSCVRRAHDAFNGVTRQEFERLRAQD